ncbi:MAG: POTRA domain-containing protein, partial [Vicinamibacteria bacterium]
MPLVAGRPPGRSRTRGPILLSTLVAFLALTATGWAQQSQPTESVPIPTVRDIVVEGNRRIQGAAIRNRAQTKIGDPLAPAALREDVRSIFGLGFFDDVQVRTEEFEGGVRVIFVVVERPLLREVSFEGNAELKTEELREKAAIRVGVLYNPVEVQKAEEAIRQKYEDEGFFGVQITPRTERTPEGDLRVVFRIEEGPKLHIDRILIEGNRALTASQVRDSMWTKERVYWIFPFSTVQRRVFEDDADRILQLYADHGYIQARVESAEIVPDLARKKVTLRVRVVEGPQFRTATVTITGNELLSIEEIRKLVQLREGDVFSRGALRNSVRAIADRYSELGRARAEVDPRTSNDLANLKV